MEHGGRYYRVAGKMLTEKEFLARKKKSASAAAQKTEQDKKSRIKPSEDKNNV